MAKILSKQYRVKHRDIEVVIEDDHGVEEHLYIGLADLARADEVLAEHVADMDERTAMIERALKLAGIDMTERADGKAD